MRPSSSATTERRSRPAGARSCRAPAASGRSPMNRTSVVHRRTARLVGQAQRASATVTGDHVRIRDRRQIDVPHPVGEFARQPRPPAAPAASCPPRRRRSGSPAGCPPGIVRSSVNLACAADETRQLHRKVVPWRHHRDPQRRELVAAGRDGTAAPPVRGGADPAAVGAEVGQPGVGREPVDDQVGGAPDNTV